MAILSRVENATESLLARCFENYYSLQENAPSGLLDGGVAAAEQPAPALQPAVELCNILRDVLKPGDQQWLTDRFKVAANRRYHRLLDGADATISRGVGAQLVQDSACWGMSLVYMPTQLTFMQCCILARGLFAVGSAQVAEWHTGHRSIFELMFVPNYAWNFMFDTRLPSYCSACIITPCIYAMA